MTSSSIIKNKIEVNSNLFPSWIVKHFKEYKLPEIMRNTDVDYDACNVEIKKELYKYQTFIGRYLSNENSFNSILIYHLMGAGKTATAINLINILIQTDNSMNVFLLIKSSLHKDPWEKDMNEYLTRETNEDKAGVKDLKIYKHIKEIEPDLNSRVFPFEILVNTWSTFDESPRTNGAFCVLGVESATKIIAKAIRLMHALVQDGDDPDVAIRQTPPIDEVMLVAEVKAFNAELSRDRP